MQMIVSLKVPVTKLRGTAARWACEPDDLQRIVGSAGGSMSPLHPGTADATLASYYVIDVRASGQPLLTPATARVPLRSTGSPQQDAPARPATQRIGNRPALPPIFALSASRLARPGRSGAAAADAAVVETAPGVVQVTVRVER